VATLTLPRRKGQHIFSLLSENLQKTWASLCHSPAPLASRQAAHLAERHGCRVVGWSARLADRVAGMFRGKVVETGARQEVYESPSHPYTQARQ
jgi:hypothetical protein